MRLIRTFHNVRYYVGVDLVADVAPPESGARILGQPQWDGWTVAVTWIVDVQEDAR
jgi:hypothetical protein